MIAIPKYQILEKIYEEGNSQVYRGIRIEDNLRVILKVLKIEFSNIQTIGKYKLEYEIIRGLSSDFVISTYGFQQYENRFIIILEDFGGESLAQILTLQKIDIIANLKLAIQISEGLSQIHAANIIHKDINPSNIVFNSHTNTLKIIDFGIASALSKENWNLDHHDFLEGTLAYISPEQTGRMNRSLDCRTDIYSMGVTFYQMFTGRLPYTSNDPLELIHYHLAMKSIAPCLVNAQIPLMLSQIILKMLAKTTEDRYQSAWGVKADLEKCLNQLETKGKIDIFRLAEQDIIDKFLIAEKLYGRAKEVEDLLAAFSRITDAQSDRVEMLLISGYSGIGKSRLVQEIYKPITQSRGYFISGKFDQYQRNIPYFAIIQALQSLIKRLLTENEDKLNQWRSQIINALGINSYLITQVIPDLELIIGKQETNLIRSNVSINESENRFNRVFQNFIRIFAQSEHPLVIFLDDLQWADRASLKLLQILATTTAKNSLLLIGAYRDNEVSETHPMMQIMEQIQQANGNLSHLFLSALNLTDITQLIADTLHCSTTEALSLAELVQQKTNGNPFFMNEFLKSLYDENLIKFNYQLRKWEWSIAQIQEQDITDNVVELMTAKIQKLSDRTQDLLQIASCIGNQFELGTLVLVSEFSHGDVVRALKEAISVGLILPLSNTHQAIHFGIEVINEQSAIAYKFVHDRVQQAAYSLISEANQVKTHQRIGQQLFKNTSTSELETKIFDIVNQLNWGLDLISSPQERDLLAQLNLIASKKAKASTAYSAAFNYAKTGVGLLGNESWSCQYELSLDLYNLAIESAFLNGDFAQMENWAEVVFNNGKTLLEKIRIYEILIQSCVAQNQLFEAIRIGIETLQLLEIEIPTHASPADVGLALQSLQSILSQQRVEDLLEFPLMTDEIALAAVNILLSMAAAAYVAASELYIFVVLQLVQLSIAKGNAEGSCYGYAAYGLILCCFMNQIEHGYQFGQLALQLLDRFTSQTLRAKTLHIVYVFINHWKYHLRETLAPLLSSYTVGIETGDFEFAAYSLCLYSNYRYFSGRELTELELEMTEYATLLAQTNQQTPLKWLHIYHQAILNLLGKSADPCNLTGEIYNAKVMIPIHEQAGDRSSLCLLYFHQLILCYLFENHAQADHNTSQVSLYLEAGIGTKCYALFYFYDTLNQLAIYSELTPTNREQTLVKVAENIAKIELWASHAPMNYLHKWHLIVAERYRVLGQTLEAMEAYDLAIAGAKANGYIQEEALANELAAKFYLSQNRITIARAYMQEARLGYLEWGALAKVQYLESRYLDLLRIFSTNISNDISTNISTNRKATNRKATKGSHTSISLGSSSNSLENLDIESFLKASQAIASEIQLERLLETLMSILIENAGVQTGYLLLPTDLSIDADLSHQDQWTIAAIKTIEYDQVALHSIPVDTVTTDGNHYVPLSIVNYVIRTQQSVVLNNATQVGDFQNDPWIVQYQVKSLLCLPLLSRGNLSGIVILDNKLATDAFTRERLKVLNLLSSQAAISISKAWLLKQKDELNQSLQSEISDRLLAEKERDRLVAIIQASTDIIGISSPQGQVLWNNTQANRVQGLPPDADVSGLDIPAYHPQWALEIIQNQGIPAAIEHGTWLGETALLTHEGIEVPVSQMIIAHKSADGNLEYISTIMRDISEAKEREVALKNSETTLQNLVAGTAAVTGDDFFPALAKHIAEALHVKYALVTELIDDQLHALAFWANGSLQPPIAYFPARTPCELALRNGEYICDSLVQQIFPDDADLVAMKADSYMGISLQDMNGNPIGNLCILDVHPLQDIQRASQILQVFAARAAAELQRKAASEELYQLNQSLELRVKQRTSQLEAANQELESFSYSVSHDLRAPLRAIDGFSRLLQEDYRDRLDPEGHRYLKIVRDNAKRMGELIDDLLNLSRLNRKEMLRRSLSVNRLIQHILNDFHPEIQNRDIEIIIADLPNCEADLSLLTQVWINLISNAIKYTSKTKKARIEIGYQVINDQGTYFIRDNGAGFDMQYADKLFGVFQRMHLDRDFEGTGIGLAIVQQIIQRHGGHVWAEAAIDQGATFYFTIPEVSS